MPAGGRGRPRPTRAASAVRLLAAVAIRSPTNPAVADSTAPNTRAGAPRAPQGSRNPISKARTATKTATQVYSRRRKAIDPSRMAAEISTMRSLPGRAAITKRA